MAKIFGLNGVLSGRQGNTVFAVRNGENIARKYQPVVLNPSTPAQVACRAKMKLLSQLSAVLGGNIAIPRVGMVSSRNGFVKQNYGATSYTEGVADINLNGVQLTKSAVALPELDCERPQDNRNNISVTLHRSDTDIDKVVYVALVKESDNRLRVATSIVVETAGAQSKFPGTLVIGENRETVVLAYGVRANNDAARQVFSNLTAVTSEAVAKVIVTSALTTADLTVTETKGATVEAAS